METNLASGRNVQLHVSITQPKGIGAIDPYILLNECAHQLDGAPLWEFRTEKAYDTYNGKQRTEPDWYRIEFAAETRLNTIEMTMGIPYHDGGWWTSLKVEVQSPIGEWRPVEIVEMQPVYNYSDTPFMRRPFETYTLQFEEVVTTAVRLIGTAGGASTFTSLARLAMYYRKQKKVKNISIPTPRIFQLIEPNAILELSNTFFQAMNVFVTVPFIEYYVSAAQRQRYYERLWPQWETEETLLWSVIANHVGWRSEISALWVARRCPRDVIERTAVAPLTPYVHVSWYGSMAQAVAPLIVDGQVLGELFTYPVMLKQPYDEVMHQQYAAKHNIPWELYKSSLQQSRQMTYEQIEGIAALIGQITNQIATLAHRLEIALNSQKANNEGRASIVRRALDFMQQHLASSISVKDVAKSLKLHPAYFCTLFTQETGKNPRDVLIDLRVTRAKAYLTYTSMSVQEVCRALSYDTSYMMRLFKRTTGYTMGEYARMQRKQAT